MYSPMLLSIRGDGLDQGENSKLCKAQAQNVQQRSCIFRLDPVRPGALLTRDVAPTLSTEDRDERLKIADGIP